MKKIVMIGAGQMGKAAAALINNRTYELLAFGDNRASGNIYGIPILTVEAALRLQPQMVILTVRGNDWEKELERQVRSLGFTGKIIQLSKFLEIMDMRKAVLLRLSERLANIDGAIAELGVYKGDFALILNRLFPRRILYLFDTFSGFTEQDVETEAKQEFSLASTLDFSDTSVEAVLSRMPHKDTIKICSGHFPATAQGLDDKFALVSLDADLYEPTLAGLEWFLPRMVSGGVLILHDWDSTRFRGIKEAVEAYEKDHGRLALVPLGDFHGTAIIIKE